MQLKSRGCVKFSKREDLPAENQGSFIERRWLNPNSELEMGAPPPRAQFSAPSRKTPAAENCAKEGNPPPAEKAGREGASSNARAGVLPELRRSG
jgi:hypothetical protein